MKNRIQEIFKPSEEFISAVSKEINAFVENIEDSAVKEMLKYGLNQKGQMIRPSLIYFTAKVLKQEIDSCEQTSLIHLACAVELLHTASLVHDDIIDNSALRRGSESIFKHYGIGNAVLTGNTFYLTAFDLANKNLSKSQVDSIIKAATDMCCGEVIQQYYKGVSIPHEAYFDIIKKKTSSIIKYSCMESAGIVSSFAEDKDKMQELGECLGILYQMSDDYKDLDINLEADFDYKLHAGNYIYKANEIINSFNDSIFKVAFEDFVEYLSMTLNFKKKELQK